MTQSKKTNQQIAIEVIAGKWGNGSERTTNLAKAGYDPSKVQSIVNALMAGESPEETPTIGTGVLHIDVDLSVYSTLELNLRFGDK